jgi:hypothetical protein
LGVLTWSFLSVPPCLGERMVVWLFLRVSAFSAREMAVGLFFGSGFAGLGTVTDF